jgi:hypothetical protein
MDTLLRTRRGRLDGQVRELELQLAQAVGAQRQGLAAIEALCAAYARRLADTAGRIAGELQALRSRADALRRRLRPPDPSPDNESPKPEALGMGHTDHAEAHRRLAREAVVAWENIADPAAREWVESALFNAGVEPIGAAGEHTEFVGRLHDCGEPGAFSGKPVQVVQPGWLLREDGGEYLLAKAQVRLAPPPATE